MPSLFVRLSGKIPFCTDMIIIREQLWYKGKLKFILKIMAWTEQVMSVLLQLMKQMLEENTGSGILQRGWDFRQMLEIAPGHQGDLCYWLSPRFGPSQSTQRRYFKNVWHSWKMTTVMPGKTTSPTDQFPVSFICLFRLKCPTFTRQDVRV